MSINPASEWWSMTLLWKKNYKKRKIKVEIEMPAGHWKFAFLDSSEPLSSVMQNKARIAYMQEN